MKKILKGLLASVLVLTLVACGSGDGKTAKEASKEFTAFVETLPTKMVKNTSFELNSILNDKEAFGFDDELYEYEFYTKEDFKKEIKSNQEIYDKLKTFERSTLDAEQQLTYDIMEDYFYSGSDANFERDYYLATNYLDSNYGYQSQMPLMLYFFDFRTKSDVDSYLNLLKTTPDFFNRIVDHEQERQNAGYGMTKSQIDVVIQQCEDFINADQSFLLDSFKEKINKMDGLSDTEKQTLIAQNEELLNNNFIEAYVQLKDKLAKLKIKSKNNVGYAAYDGGKEYFESMVQDYTGFEDIEDYRTFLEDKVEELTKDFQKIARKNPEIFDNMQNLTYTNKTTAVDVIKELEEATKEDFPEIRDIDYQMAVIPESMRSIMGGLSAAYSVSPFDDKDASEKMILNGEYSQDEFLTIAHEGFPGHMYQFQYYKEHEHPLIRDLMSYNGYSEGYANYVEQYSAKYAQDAEAAKALAIYNQIGYAEMLLLDIEIHYDGISKKEAYKQIRELYGDIDEEIIKEIFEQLLHSPALFAKYYGAGFRFADLREAMKKEMGSSYSDKEFHEALLNVGPAPYEIVEEYVTKWLVD